MAASANRGWRPSASLDAAGNHRERNFESLFKNSNVAPGEGTRPTGNGGTGPALQARCPHRAGFQTGSERGRGQEARANRREQMVVEFAAGEARVCFMHLSFAWRSWVVLILASLSVAAAPAKIIKVLPHWLDQEGRHTLSPSLYERDAYQAWLRKKAEECSALRFDIQWKALSSPASAFRLRLELRTSQGDTGERVVLEQAVKRRGWFNTWSSMILAGDDFKKAGAIIAWRATLWDGGRQIAEQKSFLWP